jgi:hypothetical protein
VAVWRARLEPVTLDGEFRLRHNPVDCDCPELEVWVAERWHRVALDDYDDPVAQSLQAAIAGAAANDVPPVLVVRGRIDPNPLPCGKAALHLVLAAETFVGIE